MKNSTLQALVLSYCYCDAGGNKKHGEIHLLNPDHEHPIDATDQLSSYLEGGEFFIARQVGLPEVFLWQDSLPTASDHCWHTFSDFRVGEVAESDSPLLDLPELRTRFAAASQSGWKQFGFDEHGNRVSLTKLPTLQQARSLLLRHKRPYRGSILAAHATWREGRLVIAITMPPLQKKSALAYTEEFHQQYARWPIPTWNGISVDFQFFTASDRFAPDYQEFRLPNTRS